METAPVRDPVTGTTGIYVYLVGSVFPYAFTWPFYPAAAPETETCALPFQAYSPP